MFFAQELLWKSQMSTHTTALSDLGDALMTCGFEAKVMSLKRCESFKTPSIISGDMTCCSNHSSLKDKWSHNEQSSPMGYQVKSGGITRELNKELSLHCSSIYTTTSWSVLQQYVYLMSIHHASTSCLIIHPHVFFLRPPCFLHVPWRHTFNLRYTYTHHEELMSLDVIPNSNSF